MAVFDLKQELTQRRERYYERIAEIKEFRRAKLSALYAVADTMDAPRVEKIEADINATCKGLKSVAKHEFHEGNACLCKIFDGPTEHSRVSHRRRIAHNLQRKFKSLLSEWEGKGYVFPATAEISFECPKEEDGQPIVFTIKIPTTDNNPS